MELPFELIKKFSGNGEKKMGIGGGTEAFPGLGAHCSYEDCYQLDFLPFNCDGCQKVCTFMDSGFGLFVCLLYE